MGDLSERRGGEVSGWLLADLAVVQEFVIHDIRLALKYVIVFLGSLVMMLVTSPKLSLILFAILSGGGGLWLVLWQENQVGVSWGAGGTRREFNCCRRSLAEYQLP